MAMAQSTDLHAQCAAAEALAHAASDKKRCRGVLTEVRTTHDSVVTRARALLF